jgi:peptidoglycan L-alanyl-D-glutamate endopeptidase CwlK
MPLGRESKLRLATCDPRLQQLVTAVAAKIDAGALAPLVLDISVACGHRGKADQNREFAEGDSKLPWPRSKHNTLPALAVDVWPYPVDWKPSGRPAFEAVRELFLSTAHELGIPIHVISWDLPHFQLA